MKELSVNGGIAAVIVAAGSAQRFGEDKTEALICGIPCIAHTLAAFEKSKQTVRTVVVTRKEKIGRILELKEKYGFSKLSAVVEGGQNRQESAAKGFAAADPSLPFIAVHDGARPLILPEDIDKTAEQAYEFGAAIAVMRQTNTVKMTENGFVAATLPRENTVFAATPQIFSRKIYENMINALQGSFADFTDDSSMAEKLGVKVKAVFCDPSNIKITLPCDITVAQVLFEERLRD